MKIVVTGGAGFIGANLVRHLLATEHEVVVLDALTYAAWPVAVEELQEHPRFTFVRGDLCDGPLVAALLAERQPDAVLHLAAETHVDRSIKDPTPFLATNVTGTFTLLEAVRRTSLPPGFRLVCVSTDEVFGALGPTGFFDESSPYRPSSPYAASKAAADHLARAWAHTYGLPVIVTHACNNYGPWQFPEKLIPLAIARACAGEPIPVYGDGLQVRDWLFVADHARALALVVERGEPGQSYVVGGRDERPNRDVLAALCAELDRARPAGAPHARLLTRVTDRPGHDRRYAVDPSKIERELGFAPRVSFAEGLRLTVEWYLARQ